MKPRHTAPCCTHQILECGLYSIEIMKCWSSKHNAPAWGVDINFMGLDIYHAVYINRSEALKALEAYCCDTFGNSFLDDIHGFITCVGNAPLNAAYEYGESLQ